MQKFTKAERLSSKKEITALFNEGKSFAISHIRVVYRFLPKQEERPNAILVSVPKKYFKHAVDRNLLKRRIREAYRLNKELLQSMPARVEFMLLYQKRRIATFAEIEEIVKKALERILAEPAQRPVPKHAQRPVPKPAQQQLPQIIPKMRHRVAALQEELQQLRWCCLYDFIRYAYRR